MRNGILVGGNWIIDQLKVVDKYPSEERLANILNASSSNGGAAYNVLKDLYKMKVPFSLEGIGLVGSDENGAGILNECKSMGINVSQLKQTENAATSFTDVMTVQSTGKRTFFHHRGANAHLDEAGFNLSSSEAKIFYLGYLLLLDKMDRIDPDGSTGASRVFRAAKEKGFITAADVVSEDSERFTEVIPASLPYIDYLFINEFEAGMLTRTETVTSDGRISVEGCYKAAKDIMKQGKAKWVILHAQHIVIAVSAKGEKLMQPAVRFPAENVRGSVGAGDALAAGVLMGIHEGWDMQRSLKMGVSVAAASLSSVTASDGILAADDCLNLAGQFGFYERNEVDQKDF